MRIQMYSRLYPEGCLDRVDVAHSIIHFPSTVTMSQSKRLIAVPDPKPEISSEKSFDMNEESAKQFLDPKTNFISKSINKVLQRAYEYNILHCITESFEILDTYSVVLIMRSTKRTDIEETIVLHVKQILKSQNNTEIDRLISALYYAKAAQQIGDPSEARGETSS